MMHVANNGVNANIDQPDAFSVAFKEYPLMISNSATPESLAPLDPMDLEGWVRRILREQRHFAVSNPPHLF